MSFDMPPALPAKLKGADGVPGLEQKKGCGGKQPWFKMLPALLGMGTGLKNKPSQKWARSTMANAMAASPARTERRGSQVLTRMDESSRRIKGLTA